MERRELCQSYLHPLSSALLDMLPGICIIEDCFEGSAGASCGSYAVNERGEQLGLSCAGCQFASGPVQGPCYCF